MDEFGVLVESIGFKSQRNSAPMANLKGKTYINDDFSSNLGNDAGIKHKISSFNVSNASNSNSINGSLVNDLDGIFGSSGKRTTQNRVGFDGYDDIFGVLFENSKATDSINVNGSAFDLDSVFKGSDSSNVKPSNAFDDGGDIFGGISSLKSSASGNHDDFCAATASPPRNAEAVEELLGNFGRTGSDTNDLTGGSVNMKKSRPESDDFWAATASPPRQSDAVDDLLENFGRAGSISNDLKEDSKNVKGSGSGPDELIPGFGFGRTSASSYGSTSTLVDDPFSNGLLRNPLKKDTGRGSSLSSIAELEDFAMGKVQNNVNKPSHVVGKKEGVHVILRGENKAKQKMSQCEENIMEKSMGEEKVPSQFEGDLDSFFSTRTQSSCEPKAKSMTQDSMFDALFPEEKASKVEPAPSGTSSSKKKVSSATAFVDDFSVLFGAAPSEEFQEVEGESEERRKARLNHHMRTQARMAKALAEKNQRDFQAQQEQEEKHRIGETISDDIKRWAAGKEGNLRALLSSLQQVLWPECGWQPVSLTDLITSMAVKKVYYKATLCVHPDKVQQKGATLQQKYVAEKVFDLLKEAWNKFNKEELR